MDPVGLHPPLFKLKEIVTEIYLKKKKKIGIASCFSLETGNLST
jgi:hypothetical protein